MNKIQIAEPFLGKEEWEILKRPLETGWLTQGPFVEEFEKKVASYLGVKNAIATTSCTTALHLGLVAAGVKPGDEVIVPSFTWVATANAVLYCGANPVLCDVDPVTFNIDVNSMSKKLSSKTRAVIPVHLFGKCAPISKIKEVLPENVMILEDAACALGAKKGDRFVGSLGDLAAFSFHPRKTVTTGEGGMLTTDSDELAEKARVLRNHGASVSEEVRHHGPMPYILPDFNEMGFNYRMSDLQGAIGVVQMDRLKGLLEERNHWAQWYSDQLADLDWIITPKVERDETHAWQSYVVGVKEKTSPASRNEIMKVLQDKGISTRPGTHAIHQLGYFNKLCSIDRNEFPGSEYCAGQTMAIPLHNKMKKNDFERVVRALKEFN